jgi:hypothetical protein
VEGKAEKLLELVPSVCGVGFSCFPCVCFCCKLRTDVSSWATPDQLEVVIRHCQSVPPANVFFPLPFEPLFLSCRSGSHSWPSLLSEATLLCFHRKYVLSS